MQPLGEKYHKLYKDRITMKKFIICFIVIATFNILVFSNIVLSQENLIKPIPKGASHPVPVFKRTFSDVFPEHSTEHIESIESFKDSLLPGSPPSNFRSRISQVENGIHSFFIPQQITDGFATTVYTFNDITVFSYFDNTNITIYNQSGGQISSRTLRADTLFSISPGSGIYKIVGNQSYTVLVGDAISSYVNGYFAVDQAGRGVSTKLNTWMMRSFESWGDFIIFAYNDNTDFVVKNLSTGNLIYAGTLNTGQHLSFASISIVPYQTPLQIVATKPVSALSYTDQDYYVPSTNGTFLGNLFYGYSAYAGNWTNSITVTSYQDNNSILVRNSNTGATIAQYTLMKGQVYTTPISSPTFWTVTSTKSIAVANIPFAGWTGNYAYMTRPIDSTGTGAGKLFYFPSIQSTINVFSYEAGNSVTITELGQYNQFPYTSPTVIYNGTLGSGDVYTFTSPTGNYVYKVEATKNVSILQSNLRCGADFVPLSYAFSLPDLGVSTSDILFSVPDTVYLPGDMIQVTVIVHNYGMVSASNIVCKAYDGDPDAGGSAPVLHTATIPSISPSESGSFSFSFTIPASPQYRSIVVKVDPDNAIVESNESNNKAQRFLRKNTDLMPPLAVVVTAPSSLELVNGILSPNPFRVVYTIINNGTGTATNVQFGLQLFDGLTLDSGFVNVNLGNMPVTTSRIVQVKLRANQNVVGFNRFDATITASNAQTKVVNRAVYVPAPLVILRIFDANNNPIPNKEFKVYKVNNDLTEVYKGNLTTDSEGKFGLNPMWFSVGDRVKLERIVYTHTTAQTGRLNHEAVDNVVYQIKIDNTRFDASGNISYHSLTNDPVQTIVLDHTTVTYNLVVSVEWDADQAYLQNLLEGFRYTSNYLYDVTDGQLYLNKIAIYDTARFWNDVDVKIYANNQQWPQVDNLFRWGNNRLGGGIMTDGGIYVNMPRIFYFNNYGPQRKLTYSLYPYNWKIRITPGHGGVRYVPSRTLAHEFGHYGIGFLDEYVRADGTDIFPDWLGRGIFHFGLMDDQIQDDPQNSEMSTTALQYNDPGRQVTWQWTERGNRSCWDYFRWNYEGTYDGIYCPIKIPQAQMNSGPNDDVENPQYDVGSFVLSSPILNYPGGGFTVDVLNRDGLGFPIDGSRTTLFKDNRRIVIEQGKTADNGRIRVLGANNGDIIRCYARIGISWFFSELTVGGSGISLFKNRFETVSQDSLIVTLRPIVGNIQMVNEIAFTQRNTLNFGVLFGKPLPSIPDLELFAQSQLPVYDRFSSTQNNARYSITLQSPMGNRGSLNIIPQDDSLNTFFINQNYLIKDSLDIGWVPVVFNFDGSMELRFGQQNNSIQKLFVLSTDFNPILEGLENEVERGGAVHSISSYQEQTSLQGKNAITIRYADSDLRSKSEASLRIFRWNSGENNWQRIGGNVDTIRNEVTAEIGSLGTYAAFTTKIGSTGEKLDNNNNYFYPNPINPDKESGRFVFGVGQAGNITIKIYDISNNLVKKIDAGNYQSGSAYEVAWNGRNESGEIVANGVYFYVIESSSGERAIGKIAVLR